MQLSSSHRMSYNGEPKLFEGMFSCPERRGERIRRVTEVRPSPMIEAYLKQRLIPDATPIKNLSNIYSYGVRLFLVDDVGMLMKGMFELNDLVDVHIGFWDRVLVGREYMCNSMAKMVAKDAKAKGVWTALPKESRATIAFARRCGFEQTHETESIVVLALIT